MVENRLLVIFHDDIQVLVFGYIMHVATFIIAKFSILKSLNLHNISTDEDPAYGSKGLQ